MMQRVDVAQAWDDFARLAAPILAEEDESLEDVRAALDAGSAWLFAADGDFMVVQHQLRRGTMSMELLVWIACSAGPPGAIDRHVAWLADLRDRVGASRVVFKTRRRGFERALPPGWRLDHYVWTLESAHA